MASVTRVISFTEVSTLSETERVFWVVWFTCSTKFSSVLEIKLTACLLSSANLRTSSATTANPFPASPALAASIDALRAKRLVCSAISVMELTTVRTVSASLLSCSLTWSMPCISLPIPEIPPDMDCISCTPVLALSAISSLTFLRFSTNPYSVLLTSVTDLTVESCLRVESCTASIAICPR